MKISSYIERISPYLLYSTLRLLIQSRFQIRFDTERKTTTAPIIHPIVHSEDINFKITTKAEDGCQSAKLSGLVGRSLDSRYTQCL